MNVVKFGEGPVPLREGTVLDERYAVGRVLGRGGFGLTYAVEDLARGTQAVVKELAPLGSLRGSYDEIEFAGLGHLIVNPDEPVPAQETIDIPF